MGNTVSNHDDDSDDLDCSACYNFVAETDLVVVVILASLYPIVKNYTHFMRSHLS